MFLFHRPRPRQERSPATPKSSSHRATDLASSSSSTCSSSSSYSYSPTTAAIKVQMPGHPRNASLGPSSWSSSSPSSPRRPLLSGSQHQPPAPSSRQLDPPNVIHPRQDPPPSPSESLPSPSSQNAGFVPPSTSTPANEPSSASLSSALFSNGVPSASPTPSSSVNGTGSVSGLATGTLNDTGLSSGLMSSTSSGKSKPWSFTLTPSASRTTTTSGTHAAQVTFVPGVVFDMMLAGGNDDLAVYSLPMAFGHDLANPVTRKRAPTTPSSIQTMNMLVDLGSSDMWIASMNCTSKDCQTAPALFNDTHSLDSDTPLGLDFQVGSVSGNIMWEQVTIGEFGIGYQAMVSAEEVSNENLGDGNFTGLLGLAWAKADGERVLCNVDKLLTSVPANSVITQTIPGTTGSSPDGATFLDNLFGAGASAPTNRYFSLSLERSGDVRTVSSFGIGEVDSRVCPPPCAPKWLPILAHPTKGSTGYLHWRLPLESIHATFYDDPQNGIGPTTQPIPLGSTRTDANSTVPVAVLDSGGVGILVNNQDMLKAIYGAFGVQADNDGKYRLPCNTPLTLTFTFGGTDYPVHPLDMSYIDTADASLSRCLGVLQYADLQNRGDFVLGSSFLKNVYSIYQYPDQRLNPTTWQPTVGMVPLTNAAVASRDFWLVRRERQPLSRVSSGQVGDSGNNQQSAAANAGQKRVATSTIIAVCAVLGFLAIAAAAYFAWWFWNRRRHGKSGVVEYKMNELDKENDSPPLRTRKHFETMRQKSMVDGYSDFDLDSYDSTTAGTSVTGMQQALEESDALRLGETISNHARGSSIYQGLLAAGAGSPPLLPTRASISGMPRAISEPLDLRRPRTRSSGPLLSPQTPAGRLVDVGPAPSSPPSPRDSFGPSVSTPSSMAMMGAYPSHTIVMGSTNAVTSGTRTSEYDYFPVFSQATLAAGAAAEQRRSSSYSDKRSSRGSILNRTP